MKKIQMVDLQGQYQQIKETVNTSIEQVLNSSTYINGPLVHEFQSDLEKYLGVKHVIPCANGTDALQIAMMGLGLEQGDEVITADFTFAATVEVIGLLKLTPVLVDVDPVTFNIDVAAIKKAITPRTKAIVPVHLFGLAANMDEIMDLAKAHDLYVIEDNAQGIGAKYTSKDGTKKKFGKSGKFQKSDGNSYANMQVKLEKLEKLVKRTARKHSRKRNRRDDSDDSDSDNE